jgi:uncharacterized membrane protein
MNIRLIMRVAGVIMLVAGVAFLAYAMVSAPTFGVVYYVGSIPVSAGMKQVCYVLYGIVAVALFVAPFFMKKAEPKKKAADEPGKETDKEQEAAAQDEGAEKSAEAEAEKAATQEAEAEKATEQS